MSYLVEIDDGACAAHGDCVDLAPEVFVLEDVARVIGSAPDEILLAVAEACPPVLAGGLFTSSAGHGHARYYSKTIRGNGDVTGKLTVWKRAG